MKHAGMKRIWLERTRANERIVRDYAARSPVMACLDCISFGPEWRTVLAWDTKTLVRDPNDGTIRREGPVILGIRYHERFLTEAAHPMEIATVLRPLWIFHPNASYAGNLCLGHPAPGISMELIINQIWAGLMMNLRIANTSKGEVINAEAAMYVRANADQFPLTRKGLFESPDEDLHGGDWHARYDPQVHSVDDELFSGEGAGGGP